MGSEFKFGETSLARLEGVNPELIKVTHAALRYSTVDFGITCGVRTLVEQERLFVSGATKTLQSNHLNGRAVDVVAYKGKNITWDLEYYIKVADAFHAAAIETGVGIRWGGAWQVPNLVHYRYDMERANKDYIIMREMKGQIPFVDGPHFELS